MYFLTDLIYILENHKEIILQPIIALQIPKVVC